MKILLTFTFWLIPAGTAADIITVTGSSRRSVEIRCPYEAGYEDYIKYLCQGDCPVMSSRDIPVESGSPPEDGRFSLKDDTRSRVFTVTISDLRPTDAGTYWCVVRKRGYDIYTEVLLQVRTARTTGKVTVTGSAGRSVEIRCPYEAGCEGNLKYLCRGDCANEDIIKSRGQRVSLKDDTRSRVFTVTISGLRATDGGTYWCVVQKPLLDIYTEVLLQVRTVQPTRRTAPPPASSTTTPSVTPTTTAPSRDDSVRTSAPLSSAPVHTVVVPVVITLLLTGLVLLVVLYKLHKRRGQEEPPKISKEVDEVDGDDPPVEETYENLQRGTDDLDSVYENLWR